MIKTLSVLLIMPLYGAWLESLGDVAKASAEATEKKTSKVVGFVGVCGGTNRSACERRMSKRNRTQSVEATVETVAVRSSGDAADDAAIWVHPTDGRKSTVIGTDKKSGLVVYDLAGKELQYLADGPMNNVDIRYNFELGGKSVALVTAGNVGDDSIAIYRVNARTRMLERVSTRGLKAGIGVYGLCMYRSPVTGKHYVFLNSKKGEVEQWRLFDRGDGTVGGIKVRSFEVGSQTEGCVADDELMHFYIGEEEVGIWKYRAEPGAGLSRTLVDSTSAKGNLTADVEGLTIYYGNKRSGYLIASSQGSNEFVMYRRTGNNDYVMSFEITGVNGIDSVSETDGIDVVSSNLGSGFPEGLFIAQDDENDRENQNYKLVSWQKINRLLRHFQRIEVISD